MPVKPVYPISLDTTAVLGVDWQLGFGDNAWQHVPGAPTALANYLKVAETWRAKEGKIINLYMEYLNGEKPNGNISDFLPDVEPLMKTGSEAITFYPGIGLPTDIPVIKNNFSGVKSSNLLEVLAEHGITTVFVGGLTTPICVMTTVDALSMAGIKVILLRDGCATQGMSGLSPEIVQEAAVARMESFFAMVVSSEEAIKMMRSV